MTTPACDLADEILRNPTVHLGHVQQYVGSILGLTAISICFWKYRRYWEQQDTFFQVAARRLAVLLFIHNACLLVIQVWLEILNFTVTDKCALLIVTWQCIILRIPAFASIIAMTTLFVEVTVLRVLHTFSQRHADARIGRFSALCSVAFIAAVCIYIYYDEEPLKARPLCPATSLSKQQRFLHVYAWLAMLEILCIVVTTVCMVAIRRKLKSNDHNFVLSRHIRMVYSARCVRYTLALLVLRFFFITCFLFANCVVRWLVPASDIITAEKWLDGVYVVQWLAVAMPVLTAWQRSTSMVKVNVIQTAHGGEQHFKQLTELWNGR